MESYGAFPVVILKAVVFAGRSGDVAESRIFSGEKRVGNWVDLVQFL